MLAEPVLVNVNSQSANAVPLDATEPNSSFAVNVTNMNFGRPVAIGLKSISLNVAPSSSKTDASAEFDCYILCNLATSDTRIGNQKTNSLRRIVVSQTNKKQVFEFDDVTYVPCTTSDITRIELTLATDSFQSARGASVDLHPVHTPQSSNGTQAVLSIKPLQAATIAL